MTNSDKYVGYALYYDANSQKKCKMFLLLNTKCIV